MFPEGKEIPKEMAQFQNRVNKIEDDFNQNIGLNNKKVWVPETSIKRRNKSIAVTHAAMSPGPTPTDIIMEKSRNTRA